MSNSLRSQSTTTWLERTSWSTTMTSSKRRSWMFRRPTSRLLLNWLPRVSSPVWISRWLRRSARMDRQLTWARSSLKVYLTLLTLMSLSRTRTTWSSLRMTLLKRAQGRRARTSQLGSIGKSPKWKTCWGRARRMHFKWTKLIWTRCSTFRWWSQMLHWLIQLASSILKRSLVWESSKRPFCLCSCNLRGLLLDTRDALRWFWQRTKRTFHTNSKGWLIKDKRVWMAMVSYSTTSRMFWQRIRHWHNSSKSIRRTSMKSLPRPCRQRPLSTS